MLCRCSSYLEIKTRNTSTLNGGEDGGVWILLFSEVTLFESNNFVADRSLVFNLVKCHRHIEIISPLSEAFTTDQLYFNKCCFRIVAIMATVYLFKWAAWNFHRSCKWADFVAVQIGHKIKEKELKPRFHMLGNPTGSGILLFADCPRLYLYIGYSPQDCLRFSRYWIWREMESASKIETCVIGGLEPRYLED